jgi:hypothetical protein
LLLLLLLKCALLSNAAVELWSIPCHSAKSKQLLLG